jgi:hypothetical protein
MCKIQSQIKLFIELFEVVEPKMQIRIKVVRFGQVCGWAMEPRFAFTRKVHMIAARGAHSTQYLLVQAFDWLGIIRKRAIQSLFKNNGPVR